MKRLTESMLRGPREPFIISALIALLAAVDLALDLSAGTTFSHVVTMSVLTVLATMGAVYFSSGLRTAWRDEREIRKKLERDCARTADCHQAERELLLSLNKAIHRQFKKWDFSTSESEVALYLLKGLSLKDIADLRGSTPGTVKQQAHLLYHKAGLAGRAELSAFFLGGLLPKEMTEVDSPGVVQFQPNSKQRILSKDRADEPRESQSLSHDLPLAGL